MLSIILAASLGAHPLTLVPPKCDVGPCSLNEQLFGTDPAILAELARVDHTKHHISYGFGIAFMLSGAAMITSDYKLGGTFVSTVGISALLYGVMGMMNLTE